MSSFTHHHCVPNLEKTGGLSHHPLIFTARKKLIIILNNMRVNSLNDGRMCQLLFKYFTHSTIILAVQPHIIQIIINLFLTFKEYWVVFLQMSPILFDLFTLENVRYMLKLNGQMPDCNALLLCLSVTGTIMNLFSGTFPSVSLSCCAHIQKCHFHAHRSLKNARELCTSVPLNDNLTVEMFVC